jgi:hypothetical protein
VSVLMMALLIALVVMLLEEHEQHGQDPGR